MASSFYDLEFSALERELVGAGVAAMHAKALWRQLYRGADSTDLAPPLHRWMQTQTEYEACLPKLAQETLSADGLTRKFLLRLQDGQTVETVLMCYPGRRTVCVSSQVGCAMGCVFCATGQMGFVRHLSTGEIVAQVLYAQGALAHGESVRNVVFMGMGEPLHNLDAVLGAVGILTDRRGLSLSARHISVSTVGVVPGISRLVASGVNLAVSLHGATQEERAALVPVSSRWNLEELLGACREYGALTGRKIFFEWTLIEGRNDSTETAHRLAKLLHGIRSHVNLIPLNPTCGYDGVASGGAAGFQAVLREHGIPSTIRQRRGIDVSAGCGQLREVGQRLPGLKRAVASRMALGC